MAVLNALSFDLEEWFHADAVALDAAKPAGESAESRINATTQKILELLQGKNAKATFFVLGELAEKHPELVKEISKQGHEIASHSFSHKPVFRQSRLEFALELEKSVNVIKRACGKKPIGFRAPNFSITRDSLWALDVLREQGFSYDSSIFPISHFNYGIPGFERFPLKLQNGLTEFPISTFSFSGKNIPFSGGFYFRAMPLFLVKRFFKKINSKGKPVIVYLHPWELDAGQPRLSLGWKNSLRQYHNIGKTSERLEKVLDCFEFDSVGSVLGFK